MKNLICPWSLVNRCRKKSPRSYFMHAWRNIIKITKSFEAVVPNRGGIWWVWGRNFHFIIIIPLLQTRGPYHTHNHTTQEHKMLRHSQKRNQGGKAGAIPPAPNHYGGAEKSQQCHKYFLQQHICFRKASGSKMGGPNLFLAAGAI